MEHWEEIEEYKKIIAQIPDPIWKLFFLKCPRCGLRVWNCHGAEYVGYQGHYLGHMIEDMQSGIV